VSPFEEQVEFRRKSAAPRLEYTHAMAAASAERLSARATEVFHGIALASGVRNAPSILRVTTRFATAADLQNAASVPDCAPRAPSCLANRAAD